MYKYIVMEWNGSALSENASQAEPDDLANIEAGYLGPTSPMGQLPPKGERLWIDRPGLLRQAVNALEQARVVAIDAEFIQGPGRSRIQSAGSSSAPRLALLQLAIDGHCFVVDALRLHDLSPLQTVVGNPDVIILLHGAGADMRVMADRGLTVAHYYDLEATSRSIFGQNESSLAAMLQRAFALRLDKSLQRTDWARRPLPPAMIAYAARDAEVTLALYYWLDQHYHAILKLYESTGEQEPVAAWIEPFLRGSAPVSPEVAVAEAIQQGVILNEAQVYADCRAVLASLTYPLRRSRLLRLIADLALIQLTPDIEPSLQALTSDERAAAARALGRLGVKSAIPLIQPLLRDPVQDVRKAAQTALRNLTDQKPRRQRSMPTTQSPDGTRSWVIETPSDADGDDEWKVRLRAMLGE